MLLKDRTALITGCARGIGHSTVEVFARSGAHVWACCRRPDPAVTEWTRQLSETHGVRVTPLFFDLADGDAIRSALQPVLSGGAAIDVLVNNAGMVSANALFLMTPLETMRRVFEVNFFGPMRLTQLVARGMCQRKRGSVVHVASIAALDGGPGQLEYVASKAALIGATRKLAREFAPAGVRVNAVAPGLTATDMLQGMSPEVKAETLARSALGRPADPAEIAQTILFLASDLSAHVTGQVLRVDGGA